MLDALSEILSITIMFVEVICSVFIFNVLMGRKKVVKNKYLSVLTEILSLILLISIISRNIPDLVIKEITLVISCSLIMHIFYRSKFIVKLIVSFILNLLVVALDYFSMILISICLSLPYSSLTNDPLLFLLITIFSKTILILIAMLIKRIVGVKRYPQLYFISRYDWFVYILQSMSSMLALLSLIELSYHSITIVPPIILIASFGLLFLNIALFWLLEVAAQFGKNVKENALLSQQMEIELENVRILSNILSKTFDSQKYNMHDYNNQLAIIYQLINDKKNNQALDLIKSISGNFNLSFYRIKTYHNIIDAILNQKYLQANIKNVTLDIRASNLSMIKISDSLLVTIISNVIDNAIEACEKVLNEEKIVTIKLVNEDGILVFSVINPVNVPAKIENKMIATSKTDTLIHGIGLKNVALALSKCNGDYELGCDDHFFQFTALIQL